MASISKLLLDLWIQGHSPVVIQSVSHSENIFNDQPGSWRCWSVDLMDSVLCTRVFRGPWGVAGHHGGAERAPGCSYPSGTNSSGALPPLEGEQLSPCTDKLTESERGHGTCIMSHSCKWGPQTRPSDSRAMLFAAMWNNLIHRALGFDVVPVSPRWSVLMSSPTTGFCCREVG